MKIRNTTRTIDGRELRFEYWYDGSAGVRVWFAIPVDDDGNQIGDTLDAAWQEQIVSYLDTYPLSFLYDHPEYR